LAPARVYLTGHVAIEHGESVVTEREFPGRQVARELARLREAVEQLGRR
jgi:hypothetical protein